MQSGGTEPISLTHSGDLLYVVNEASGNISGRFSDSGWLTFRMHGDRPGPVQPHASDAPIPFGFAYQNSRNLIVTYVGYVATPSGVQPSPPDPE